MGTQAVNDGGVAFLFQTKITAIIMALDKDPVADYTGIRRIKVLGYFSNIEA